MQISSMDYIRFYSLYYDFFYLFSLRAIFNKTYYHEPIVAKTKSIELNSSGILDTLPTDRKNELKVKIKHELLFNFIRIYTIKSGSKY